MAVAKKRLLSASTSGRGIKVVGTATISATTIHTAVAGTTAGTYDEIWLYAYNSHTSDVELTVEWGGTTAPDDNLVVTIPYKQGRFLIVAGEVLQNALVVKAFAAVGNVIVLTGYVNTMTD